MSSLNHYTQDRQSLSYEYARKRADFTRIKEQINENINKTKLTVLEKHASKQLMLSAHLHQIETTITEIFEEELKQKFCP